MRRGRLTINTTCQAQRTTLSFCGYKEKHTYIKQREIFYVVMTAIED
jgi:hypothetical protein